MATAGTRVLREDGTIGLLSDGSIALHPSLGVCRDCCGRACHKCVPFNSFPAIPLWKCTNRETSCLDGEIAGDANNCDKATPICSCDGKGVYYRQGGSFGLTILSFRLDGEYRKEQYMGMSYQPPGEPIECCCPDDYVLTCKAYIENSEAYYEEQAYNSIRFYAPLRWQAFTTGSEDCGTSSASCSSEAGSITTVLDTQIGQFWVNRTVDQCNCTLTIEVISQPGGHPHQFSYIRRFSFSEIDDLGGIIEINVHMISRDGYDYISNKCGWADAGQYFCGRVDFISNLSVTAKCLVDLNVEVKHAEDCDGIILEEPDECESDSDCEELYADDPGTWECVNGTCVQVCETSEDCTEGYHCEDGECVPDCLDDDDCEEGYGCEGGVCVQTCGDNIDCPAGQICVDGEDHQYCEDGDRPCSVDEECSGWECVDEVCQPPEE